jgi:hypothetical protein
MDWHPVSKEDGVAASSDGWTGYTWNRRLFPDPPAFIRWLHDRDIGTALNLHPAGGVHSHEKMYDAFASFIGATAQASRGAIPFEITDPMCASAYFKCLIHPLEEGGGELGKWSWWCDWQQGQESRLPGVDPLFLLNHLHYRDMERLVDGRVTRRPVVFSRYAGPGSHRTPIGFSGDTHSTWDSLAFQPYMTATAANAAFTHWSHDIGGHTRGKQDDALYVRWVQFGCFSPILRLHSSNNPFILRMPWSFGKEACAAACDAMRLRHRLVPYVYSCNRMSRTHADPLLMPMYYVNPLDSDAYAAPAQYWFGSQLVAAPFTSPPDPATGVSRQTVWLPRLPSAGTSAAGAAPWRHLFTGEQYPVGWHAVYGDLRGTPLFAPAGAVVPFASPADRRDGASRFNSVGNPASIDLYVVAGADGSFSLFEDEESGEQRAFVTEVSTRHDDDRMSITIAAPRHAGGDGTYSDAVPSRMAMSGVIPETRTWRVHCVGVSELTAVSAGCGAETRAIAPTYDAERETATFTLASRDPAVPISMTLSSAGGALLSARDRTEKKVRTLLTSFNVGVEKKWDILKRLPALLADTSTLQRLERHEEVPDVSGSLFTTSPSMTLALVETIDGCGFSRNHASRPGAPAVVWAGRRDDAVVSLDKGENRLKDVIPLAPGRAVIVWPAPVADAWLEAKDGSPVFAAALVEGAFGDVAAVEMEMRDAADGAGPPTPVISH